MSNSDLEFFGQQNRHENELYGMALPPPTQLDRIEALLIKLVALEDARRAKGGK